MSFNDPTVATRDLARDRLHFAAREHDVVGQIVAALHRWKREHAGRPPATIEISPDVDRDCVRELEELRLQPRDSHARVTLEGGTLAGVHVHVSKDRAPRGVVIE